MRQHWSFLKLKASTKIRVLLHFNYPWHMSCMSSSPVSIFLLAVDWLVDVGSLRQVAFNHSLNEWRGKKGTGPNRSVCSDQSLAVWWCGGGFTSVFWVIAEWETGEQLYTQHLLYICPSWEGWKGPFSVALPEIFLLKGVFLANIAGQRNCDCDLGP